MKVLFICSGNSKSGISSLIKAQGESLEKYGISIEYFTIKGKGILGYFNNIGILRKQLRKNQYDVVHAHFSFSGFVAALAGAKSLVVSLMGWNVKKPFLKFLIKIFNKLFWNECIVKSNNMMDSLDIKGLKLIPNGVNMKIFKPLDKEKSLEFLGWDKEKKHVLFAANPARPIKNHTLAQNAYNLLKRSDLEMHLLQNVKFSEMVYHYNASDVVLLTSRAEGSPNVIKEAMACNCVIVSTDVGDVKERFDNVEGCYLCEQNAADVSTKISIALKFSKKTTAREKLDNLRSDIIAKKIIAIYTRVLNKDRK